MADELTILWDGKSGKEYKYWIYEIGHPMKAVPGNYCFAKETNPNTWTPIYFGETEDLSERFDHHHKIDCLRRNGSTHIHTHTSSAGKEVRCEEETDLINRWTPPCNN
jgi:hypothetical protein